MSDKRRSNGDVKHKNFSIKPIAFIRSDLKRREEAPRQGREGAANAFIDVLPSYRKALHRMKDGDELIVITWLHRSRRNV
jgi:tRNA (Thr-GGU) A37 N-methylase